MNLQQLEYLIALDKERHFARAAASCFVTQPTLSMMVQKLEEELGVKLFDRSHQPVTPTEIGVKVIDQARRVLILTEQLRELASEARGIIEGKINIGIIPTLAPYLLPNIINKISADFPNLRVIITENTTNVLVDQIKTYSLDAAILVTPLRDPQIQEIPLFYEKLAAFIAPGNSALEKELILPEDIDPTKLWLLEEGHCLRAQIEHYCELKKHYEHNQNLVYEAGNIETLKKLVSLNQGVTILPELAIRDLSSEQKKYIRYFEAPTPIRQVSLITQATLFKENLITLLSNTIIDNIPESMLNPGESSEIIPVV